ncbi:carboxypeptidase-like regulatory domain-containing protein [Pedobacter nototheniae]|uniref:carboxypeptidase-like regulatory domain-containing protein n=1 Tax=Pedobacter nototheniae TaxID=2488994 RepID=UPI00292E4626|nr:carboxypeptidase-like regulatory domain-containing protein [Pedobacter nototheniae]
MYKKSLFLFLTLLFSTLLLFAQNLVIVNGIVKDSIGNPVATASVTIISESGSGITFAKTNQQGSFSCKFQSSTEKLSIKVSSLGYQQAIVRLVQTGNETYVITLKKAVNLLKEVTIKSNSKISLSSDTLKYNVKAFRDQNDRVIADLINKLPGIQIDEKGTISYNGKRISNVYIDGDNLLDGKYGIATKSVPVDAVEQVQVIERDQPIKALNGYVVTNNVSLNLKLTDSARTITINTGHAGLGNKAYSAELNNLIFKKKVKSINNLKANNIGQDLLGENANLGTSFNNEVSLKTAQPYLSMEGGTQPSLSDKYYLMNNDYAGNLNTLFKLKSDWGLRLNFSSLQLKRKYNYSNFVNYFLPNADTISYQELQDNIYTLNQWQFQAQIEKNSNSVYLKSITKLDIPKWNRAGNSALNGLNFSQSQPAHYLSVSNETSVVKALGTDHILQYNSVVQYYKMNESLTISPGIQEDIVNDSIGYLKLDQQVYTKNIFINQSATYKLKFNQFILSTALGISFERNKLNSNLYKTDSTNVTSPVGSLFKNDVNFIRLSPFAKALLTYLLPKGSLIIETSPSFDVIDYYSAEKSSSTKNKYFLINPIIEFRKNTGRYGELNFRYSKQTVFGQINEIYPGTILVNYREFNFNETPLPKTDLISFGARYAYRKPLKMLFYNLNFNFTRTKQNFINSYIIESGLTKVIAVDFRNKADKFTLNGSLSKYLFFLETNVSVSGSFGLQKGNSYYNNEITPFDAYDINFSITARKKIFSKATLSVTGEMAKFINQQKTILNTVNNETKINKLKAEWQHNLNSKISYTLSYSFTSYRQSLQQTVRNHFLDLNVKYAPTKWKSSFEFQCINLMNQNLYQQINSSSNQLSVFQIPLRERTFLLKYSFSF